MLFSSRRYKGWKEASRGQVVGPGEEIEKNKIKSDHQIGERGLRYWLRTKEKPRRWIFILFHNRLPMQWSFLFVTNIPHHKTCRYISESSFSRRVSFPFVNWRICTNLVRVSDGGMNFGPCRRFGTPPGRKRFDEDIWHQSDCTKHWCRFIFCRETFNQQHKINMLRLYWRLLLLIQRHASPIFDFLLVGKVVNQFLHYR